MVYKVAKLATSDTDTLQTLIQLLPYLLGFTMIAFAIKAISDAL